MILISDLTFAFDSKVIFSNAALRLPEHGLVALTGSNGAGKTTLLRILGRVYRCDNVSIQAASDRTRMVYLDAGFLTLDSLSVREMHSLLARELGGPDAASLLDGGLLTPGMLDTRLSALSLGQRQRCVLNIALGLRHANVLLLDEPLNGLDEAGRAVARRRLVEASRRRTIIFATHDDTDVSDLADHVLHIDSPHEISLDHRCPRAVSQDIAVTT